MSSTPSKRLSKEKLQKTVEWAWKEFPDLGERRGGTRAPDVNLARYIIRQTLEQNWPGTGYGNPKLEKYMTQDNVKKAYDALKRYFKKQGVLPKKYKDPKFSRRKSRARKSRSKSGSKSRSKSSSRKRSGNCPRPCPTGKICNRASRRCVKSGGRAGKALAAGKSTPKKKSKPKVSGCPRPCPTGKICNPSSRRCVKSGGRVGKKLD